MRQADGRGAEVGISFLAAALVWQNEGALSRREGPSTRRSAIAWETPSLTGHAGFEVIYLSLPPPTKAFRSDGSSSVRNTEAGSPATARSGASCRRTPTHQQGWHPRLRTRSAPVEVKRHLSLRS